MNENPFLKYLVTSATTVAIIAGSLIANVPPAQADTIADAQSFFALGVDLETVEIKATGNITTQLATAVGIAGNSEAPRLVHIPAGTFTVNSTIRPASYVYIIAEAGTLINWKGSDPALVRFTDSHVGIYGGTWNGDYRGGKDSNVFTLNPAKDVKLGNLSITKSSKQGIALYPGAEAFVQNIKISGAKQTGIQVSGGTLTMKSSSSINNDVDGVTVTEKGSATLEDVTLTGNGKAVKGSTDGKIGHGLGVFKAGRATVTSSKLDNNKVCGLSLAGANSKATVTSSTMSDNGRHGVGTTAGVSVTLIDSTVAGNKYNGVLSSGKKASVALTNVTISSAKEYGLSVQGGLATIENTTITKSGIANISVRSKGALLTLKDGNTIKAAKKSHGAAISAKAKLVISGTDNVFTANKRAGIFLQDKGTTGSFTKPISVTKNKDNGIFVKAGAKVTMVKSKISGNKGKAILKKSGAKVTTKKK